MHAILLAARRPLSGCGGTEAFKTACQDSAADLGIDRVESCEISTSLVAMLNQHLPECPQHWHDIM